MQQLPQKPTADQECEADAPRAPEKPAWKVLLVEDCPDSQRLLLQILRSEGSEVTLECNGQAALDRLASNQSNKDGFDLIVTDLQMPILDGIEMTRQVRKKGCTIPIVMCSAVTEPAVHQRALDAGCNSVLTKSAAHDDLVKLCSAVLAPVSTPKKSEQLPPGQKMTRQRENRKSAVRDSSTAPRGRKSIKSFLPSNDRLATIISDVIDALVVVLDPEGRIVFFNRACERATGYSFEAIEGQPIWMFLIPEEIEPTKAVFKELRASSFPNRHQKSWVSKDGSHRSIAWSNAAIMADDGTIEYVVSTGIDNTDRFEAEKETQWHREQLAHVLRLTAVDAIAGGLFHELSQPLTAIFSYVSTCREVLESNHADQESERLNEILAEAETQTDRALQIVNGLRRLMQKRAPKRSHFNINGAIQTIVSLIASHAKRSGVTVDTELSENIPEVEGDPIQLEQVILNLMNNAIEAMESSEDLDRRITVQSSFHKADGIKVSVADTGPGFPPESLPHVFDPYYTTKVNGFGLGLSISKSIIEAHSGRISASANPDRGVTFCLMLPTGMSTEKSSAS